MKKYYLSFVIVLLAMIGTCGCSLSSQKDTSSENITTASQTPSQTQSPTPVAATATPEVTPEPTPEVKPVSLGFVGDLLLLDGGSVMSRYKSTGSIKRCLQNGLLEQMKNVDIMMVNNEFPFSDRGSKWPDKMYTFRSQPKNAKILKEMGADIVSLANNHVLDYGEDALLDTFKTLNKINMPYIGAGNNIEEAEQPYFFTKNGKKIGYFASSQVLPYGWTASSNHLGSASAYDSSHVKKVIKKIKKQCDVLIVYLHWGVEYKNYPENYQREWAKSYIDSGADAVIGCHPHVIQGVEYYNDKPIVYSLANFWFDRNTKDSLMVKLSVEENNDIGLTIVPLQNSGGATKCITDAAQKKTYLDFMRKISFNVSINKKGVVTPKETTEDE